MISTHFNCAAAQLKRVESSKVFGIVTMPQYRVQQTLIIEIVVAYRVTGSYYVLILDDVIVT